MRIARNSRTRGGRRRVCRSPHIQAVPICVCVTQSVRQVRCGAADGWMDDSARLCILDRRRRKGNPNCDLSHLNGCRADADCRSLSLSPFLVMYVQTSERHEMIQWALRGLFYRALCRAPISQPHANRGNSRDEAAGRSRMPGNVLALSFSSCTIVVQVFLWCPQRESEISLSQGGERERERVAYTQ